jgi:hypothetical protein
MASRRATEGPKKIHPTRPKLAEELQTALPLKAAVVLDLKCFLVWTTFCKNQPNFAKFPTVTNCFVISPEVP